MTSGSIDRAITVDGWRIVAGVLDAETAASARGALDRIFESESDVAVDRGWSTEAHRIAYALPVKDPLFVDIATRPAVLDIARAVLGGDAVLAAANGIDLVPGGPAQELHRDHPDPVDGATIFLHIVVALDPFTPENGGTRFVSGSHRGIWRRGDAPGGPVRAAEVPAGGAIVYDGCLVHGAGANRTEQPRRALHLFYARWWARPHWDFPAMMAPEQVAGLSAEHRDVFGFAGRPRRFDPAGRRVVR